jgi:hypothetical protein
MAKLEEDRKSVEEAKQMKLALEQQLANGGLAPLELSILMVNLSAKPLHVFFLLTSLPLFSLRLLSSHCSRNYPTSRRFITVRSLQSTQLLMSRMRNACRWPPALHIGLKWRLQVMGSSSV